VFKRKLIVRINSRCMFTLLGRYFVIKIWRRKLLSSNRKLRRLQPQIITQLRKADICCLRSS
jgi:hypothetical protein